MEPLPKLRFDALAGYSRSPLMPLSAQEVAWYQDDDQRLLGVVSLDLVDRDYVATVLARDAVNRYRAVNVRVNLPSPEAGMRELESAIAALRGKPDSEFHQGDEKLPPQDFFTPVIAEQKQNPLFLTLTTARGYTPALGLLRELMHHYHDADGNFVEQFQSTGFDPRLWELYLYALFTELGYGLDRTHAAPDFQCQGLRGKFFVEATTINPSAAKPIVDEKNEAEYYANYVPLKYGSALFSKLKKRYWELPHVAGHPLALAVQDFHAPQAMVWSNSALVEYLYGVRQIETKHENGGAEIVSERVVEYEWEGKKIPAGFFLQPDSEHISAVIANPGGTLTKFNRMGYLAGFGDRSIGMVRGGFCYRGGLTPERYADRVHEPGYSETWCEGVSVYHNPNANIPLPEFMVPGAAHHTLREGRIVAEMPAFFPLGTQTYIMVPDESA